MLTNITEAEQLMVFGQTALSILIILLIGLILYVFIWRGVDKLHQAGYISEALRGVIRIFVRWAIFIVVVFSSLQQLGLPMTSIWAALSAFVVFIGVGFVAVWSVLSNAMCAMLLLVFRPFSIGDEIEIIEATGGEGLRGKVVNINLLYTFIIEETGHNGEPQPVVQVPNNIFFQKTLRRWPGLKTRSLEETIFKNDAQSIRQNTAL